MVTAPYRAGAAPSVSWLRLSEQEREAIDQDRFGDADT